MDSAPIERPLPRLKDCLFYHSMDLPSIGKTSGIWNLRPNVDAYLGRVDFADQRVIEIGPANGFLTFTTCSASGSAFIGKCIAKAPPGLSYYDRRRSHLF
jgi:hypothetical protein